jgi:phosphoglycolate phosphatase
VSALPLLVFDLDGTLSDPSVGIGRSLNHALQHYGHPPIPAKEVSQYIGPPLDHAFRSRLAGVTPEHIRELVAKYRERYAEVGFAENVIYPGIAEALYALDAAGVPLGLCTSKRADFAESILELFDLRDYFRFVSGGDIGVRKSDQLATLIDQRRISTSATMIGDRSIDVLAARENGLKSVAVLWGHGSRDELEAALPDVFVESPHELPDARRPRRARLVRDR